jgi:hypothetical protein
MIASALLAGLSATALAQDQARDQEKRQTREQIRDQDIYGHQLMTPKERNDYRAKMRAAKTEQERGQYVKEHHERMQARAKERGMRLPDEPSERGKDMGPRDGMGPGGGGMGPGGGGMGPGGGGMGGGRR